MIKSAEEGGRESHGGESTCSSWLTHDAVTSLDHHGATEAFSGVLMKLWDQIPRESKLKAVKFIVNVH